MTDILLIACSVMLLVVILLQILLLLRKVRVDLGPVEQALKGVQGQHESTERVVREEFGQNRTEAATSSQKTREELNGMLHKVAQALLQKLMLISQTTDGKLTTMRDTVEKRLALLQQENAQKLDSIRIESASSAKAAREEVTLKLGEFTESLARSFAELNDHQKQRSSEMNDRLVKLTETTENKLESHRRSVDERLQHMQADSAAAAKLSREELQASLKGFNDSVLKGMESLKTGVDEKLKSIQDDNSKQLEAMRQTVDEKLQGTLDKRLNESFQQVSERLEQVHKGLGEMQTLATGVGDLKRVLTNVKSRGTWGEVQLAAMLEQVLTVDQYDTNVCTKEGSERVEFAIKFPGRTGNREEVLWLPIDSKFPIEDYQRLVEAQERADGEAAEAAARQLEIRVKSCAKDIFEKYVNPPQTTDFGILFLPTEGLFAEVMRRIGLSETIQRDFRVVIAGPTTLWSILNSLQMGFRTLAIEKRSSEVWSVLGAVKTEWSKFGGVLEKVQKKLQEASNTIDQAQVRTRAIGRRLRGVEELPADTAAAAVLMLGDGTVLETDLDEDN